MEYEQVDKKGWMKTGFVKAENQILREMIYKCGSTATVLYLIILSHRRMETNKCFPSIELLSRECNCSKSTISKNLTKLYNAGFLQIDSGRRNLSNNYYFPKEWFYEEFNEEDILQVMTPTTKRRKIKKKKSKKKKETEKEEEKEE